MDIDELEALWQRAKKRALGSRASLVARLEPRPIRRREIRTCDSCVFIARRFLRSTISPCAWSQAIACAVRRRQRRRSRTCAPSRSRSAIAREQLGHPFPGQRRDRTTTSSRRAASARTPLGLLAVEQVDLVPRLDHRRRPLPRRRRSRRAPARHRRAARRCRDARCRGHGRSGRPRSPPRASRGTRRRAGSAGRR